MVFKHSYWLPIMFSLLMPITFIITYTSSVLNENVKPVFPYISDTGNWSPESCIFALLLTFGALLLFLIIYIRYRQIKELCEKNDFKPYIRKFNTIALYLGLFASFGIIVVASFQETNVFVVHILGAGMCFGLGSIYHTIQVVLAFSMYPTFGNKSVNICRAICTFLYFVALSVTMIFLLLSLLKFTGNDITKWVREDGGYDEHLVSSIAEWIMVAFNQLLVLMFTWEFKVIQFSEPKISVALPPSLLRGSVAVVAALVLTAVAAPPQPFPSSPCPEVFNYDAINDPGRWTGNLVLESEDELHGVWTRLIFDSPPQEVVAEGFEVVHDVGSKDILIKNRDVVLKAGSARNVKITVIYEGDKFPNLVEYRLNARTVCPRPNTTLNTYFEGDDKAKDFLSLILSKAKPTALKPAFECGTKKGDSYPWQASLSVQRSGNSDYVCEATLISSSHVVAPAHCVTFENEIEKIPNGVLSVALAGGKKYEVKKVNVHQGYDPETLSNDIAVLELTSVLQINDNIRPICLDNQSKIENKAILVGKGLGEDGKIDNKVVGVNVEAIDSTECAARNAELSGTLADNTFCVTHLPEKSTCIGNSGSNIISFKDNVATLKGIVILGPILQNEKHCGPDTSAVVIDVSKYYKWILRSIS